MTNLRRGRGLLILLTGMAASVAHAGSVLGAVDYGPLPAEVQSVPTLSEWMLLATGLLLAVVAWRVLRVRGASGRLMAHLVLIGGVAASGLAGHDLIQRAEAAPLSAVDLVMDKPGGGTVVTWYWWTRFNNTSGVPQQIKAVRLFDDAWFKIVSPPPELPECKVGLVVAPGAKCSVLFDYAKAF